MPYRHTSTNGPDAFLHANPTDDSLRTPTGALEQNITRHNESAASRRAAQIDDIRRFDGARTDEERKTMMRR